MAVTNPERYMNEDDASQVFQTIKSYVLSHSGGGGGGGSTSEPDGNYTITRNSSGDIQAIVFTDLAGTKTVTTTFAETSTTKYIVESTVLTGATTATVKTTTITGNSMTTRTTTEPVS